MTTIDSIMALVDAYAGLTVEQSDYESLLMYEKRIKDCDLARQALLTALTEALAAQPAREPLSISWPHRVEHISALGYVVWRDVFEGVMRCTLRDAVLTHKVALFVAQDEADDYAHYRNTRTATLGTDAIEPVKHGIGGDK